MPQHAYSVTTAIDDHQHAHVVYADTAGKARYQVLSNAQEAWPSLTFRHIKVRSLGVRETPRERAERQRDDFNRRYPVGTPVRCYPGAMGDHERAYDTTVQAPGAFIMGGDRGTQVSVKVPGDSIAITHVVPLVPIATPSQD
ncbi:hypothetical protein [Azospirillum argentinense]|uniref:Uncharacterized protein n=1 Tax=Azospirillum argentinense TaxID=2970906 RepID=A0A5B0KZR2_9PROT|nr:hypothetical protein [Azospirillum argentinense]KAA1057203.1 hypothetical protein FH063_001371 [Azospirillum argentinense]